MSGLRYFIFRHRAFCCLLAAPLLAQLLFPLHLHLHHGDDTDLSPGHHHVVDYHPVTDAHTPGHPDQDDTFELKATPEVIMKKALDRDFPWFLAACLLVLVPVAARSLQGGWARPREMLRYYLYYDLAPPARAPPAL